MLEAAYPRVLRSTVVAKATSKDPTLAKLRDALWSGAETRDPEFRFYADRNLQDYSPRNYRVLTSGADHGPIHSYMAITLPYDFTFLFTPSTPMGSVELCHIHYHGTCSRAHNTWPGEHTGALGYTI
ncbi:hypothetical protein MTO96_042544 [Rhipicephalus appendiculatus]